MKSKLILLPAVALLLAGCGETPTESAPTSNNGVVDGVISEKVTIDFWTKADNGYRYVLEDLVESFKSIQPNVTVNFVSNEAVKNYNELETLVLQGLTTGMYPNIVQAYAGHAADYMSSAYGSKILNMDNFINGEYGWTEQEKANFNLSAGTGFAKEGTYILPFNKSTEILYYNRDKLVGLDLSSYNSNINDGRVLSDAYLQNLTWEELFEKLAPAILAYDEDHPDAPLLKKDKEEWAILHYEDDSNHFITTHKQYNLPYTSIKEDGTPSIDFNCDLSKNHMKKVREYAKKHYISTRWSTGGTYSANTMIDDNALFAVNSTAGAEWFYNNSNPINYGIGHVPYAEGQKRYVVEQGTSLAFLDRGNELENLASWLFYKHISSYENALRYSLESGYLPLRNDVYDDPSFIATFDPEQYVDNSADKITAQVLSFAKTLNEDYFTEAPFVGSSAARSNVSYLNSFMLGRPATPADDLTDEQIDAKYEEYYNISVGALEVK